jgi:uncharacterized protein (DUF58 family)
MERHRPSLTSRGAFALAAVPISAFAGLIVGAEELVLLSLALLSLLVGGALQCGVRAGRARGNMRMAVRLESSDAEVGGTLTMAVELTGAGRGGAVPTWLEDPSDSWQRVGRSTPVEAGPPRPNPTSALPVPGTDSGGATTLRFAVPTAHRGVFTLTGLRLWCFDSFGLVSQLVAAGPSATVTIHPVPAIVEVTDDLLRGEEGPESTQLVASSAHLRRDNFGDFAGLRPYVPGDRLRLLYWPALARTGELMVRDFEDVAPRRVHVVVDVRPLIGYRGTEAVLAAAAGVGLQVLAQGATLELSTSSGERIGIGPGSLSDMALLRSIAAIESTPPPPQSGRRRRRRLPTVHVAPGDLGFAAQGGLVLVITTEGGMHTLPSTLHYTHVVLAK